MQHVTLSTLYGLTVIFTSHPYAQLSYENGYPVSFVKELKKQGFHTAFLRGANETYMEEFREKINSMGLTDHITMHGFQSNVREYYQRASIFLLTSQFEGYPLGSVSLPSVSKAFTVFGFAASLSSNLSSPVALMT